MRIAVVTATDPYDARSWSGTHRSMVHALEALGHDVVPLGPLNRRPGAVERARSRLEQVAARGRYKHRHGLAFARWWGSRFSTRLESVRPDVVFAPAAAPEAAFIRSAAPLVYLSDATWSQVVDDYPLFEGLSPRSRRDGAALDRRAAINAAAVVYPSEWAGAAATKEYGLDRSRVHVIPFGANLVPERPSRRSPPDCVRLLFVAADWSRKGGDLALDAFRLVRESGVDTRLVVCGCTPPQPIDDNDVTVVPFLDRNDAGAAQELAGLFEAASVFVLPTRADCFPIVVCEAAAFGLPIVAAGVGGIPEAVDDGTSGIVLPPSATADAYAAAIHKIVAHGDTYADMASASRERHELVLNWSSWSTAMTSVFESVAA